MDSLSELDSRNISGQLEKKLQTTQEGLETKPTSTSNLRILYIKFCDIQVYHLKVVVVELKLIYLDIIS